MPLDWDELRTGPEQWALNTAPMRLRSLRDRPVGGLLEGVTAPDGEVNYGVARPLNPAQPIPRFESEGAQRWRSLSGITSILPPVEGPIRRGDLRTRADQDGWVGTTED
jgi:hypothetical protein